MTDEQREQWENVDYRIDAEGFHYCFTKYSDFTEIADPEFHRLRQEYLQAAAALEDYIFDRLEEDELCSQSSPDRAKFPAPDSRELDDEALLLRPEDKTPFPEEDIDSF